MLLVARRNASLELPGCDREPCISHGDPPL